MKSNLNVSKKDAIKGQATLEVMIGMMLLALPTTIVVLAWFGLEWNKTKCAHEAFIIARAQMIRTHAFVHYEHRCGTVIQTVELSPLEDLDLDKGALGVSDAQSEVSRLSAAASHLHLLLSQ